MVRASAPCESYYLGPGAFYVTPCKPPTNFLFIDGRATGFGHPGLSLCLVSCARTCEEVGVEPRQSNRKGGQNSCEASLKGGQVSWRHGEAWLRKKSSGLFVVIARRNQVRQVST